MKIRPFALGVLSLLLWAMAWITRADDNPFQTEFEFNQQAHPKAPGRLGEGYQMHSFFRFPVPRQQATPNWSELGASYLAQVRPGIVHLSDPAGNTGQAVQAAAPLPCDIRYIFSKAKGVEAKGVKEGFNKLSTPERSIYNFSKKYIHDQEKISFTRQLRHGEGLSWQPIADHFQYSGKPLWGMEELLANFNQFAIDGWVRLMVIDQSDSERVVIGEINLTLDADIIDRRVIGLLLSVPLKASLKGQLPTKAVFSRVAEKLKSVDADNNFQCREDEANSASLAYGIPNFVNSYLESLRGYLGGKL